MKPMSLVCISLAMASSVLLAQQTPQPAPAPTPAPAATPYANGCLKGDSTACAALSKQLSAECQKINQGAPPPSSLQELEQLNRRVVICQRTAQCYANDGMEFKQGQKPCPDASGSCILASACDNPSLPDMGITPLPAGHDSRFSWWAVSQQTLDAWISNTESNLQIDGMWESNFGGLLGGAFYGAAATLRQDTAPWSAWDTDQRQNLWVCAAHIIDHNTNKPIWVAGKLIGKKCNVSWDNTVAIVGPPYIQMVTIYPNHAGHWGPVGEGDLKDAVFIGGDVGEPLTYPCIARYTSPGNIVDKAAALITGDNSDNDHGNHFGHLVGDKCHIEWNYQDVEANGTAYIFYLTPKPTAGAPAPAPPTPTTPSSVANCAPQTIWCGELAQPDQYPGDSLSCPAGKTGSCAAFVCTPDAYTRPHPVCQ